MPIFTGWARTRPEDSFQSQRCVCDRCDAKTSLGHLTRHPTESFQCESVASPALQSALALDKYSASCWSAMSRHW